MAFRKDLLAAALVTILTAGALFFLEPGTLGQNLAQEQKVGCINRDTIVKRGQDWVDKHVPYNQGGTHDGYRTDCSGFISMCWELSKPGLTTQTMHTVASNISKDQLLHGDALNCDSEHIILFAGWSDSSKTHFIGME